MFIHDLIKIALVNEGYLPNYPYHLISDKEMCDAFMGRRYDASQGNYYLTGYYVDNYPVQTVSPAISDVTMSYDNLTLSIYVMLQLYLLYQSDNKSFTLPDWVYSYLLGTVISVHSDKKDIHDLIYPLGVDNIDDVFTAEAMSACNAESIQWIRRSNQVDTMTIPSEYITSIESMLTDFYMIDGTDSPTELYTVYNTAYDIVGTKQAKEIYMRPPTIYGEAHVIKSIRLRQIGGE